MKNSLYKSIAVIFVLVILIIGQHIIRFFDLTQLWITLPINMGVVVFTSIYFIQLIYNFRNYLSITNIKYKVFLIIISYVLIYLSEMNAEALKGSTFSANHYFKIVLGLLFLFVGIVNINLLVQYGILGYRLLQKKDLPDVNNMGFTFLYLIPISFVGIIICVVAGMKDFAQIFIIFELLPYWFSYKIYKELIVSENLN